jgi:hypothetical protein
MVFAVALALLAQPQTSRWIEHYRDATQAFAVDVLSLRIEGDRRTFWRRISHLSPLPNGAAASFFNVVIDCRARTSTILAALQRDQGGNIIQEATYPDPRSEPVAPYSLGEELLESVCVPPPG